MDCYNDLKVLEKTIFTTANTTSYRKLTICRVCTIFEIFFQTCTNTT